ncbi:testis-expressed protein 26 isoform X2 [Tiliqua scincoides]|uniref:testis-expressed protein 26 isoform X2 n=1 Tax=Tiliqua scincoides TaxID=71010 RepID=UPI003462B214
MDREKAAVLPPINRAAAEAPAALRPVMAPPWRPRSARVAPPAGRIQWDPYESTMKHDFVFKPTTEPNADCARAGRGQVIPLQADEPTGRNTYKDEFCWKPYSKAEPIRTGSASNVRRNNPQPSNRFLIWKLPREEPSLVSDNLTPWSKPITKQEIEETMKKQYRTVYSADYLGIQPGASRDAASAPPDWKMLVPQPPDTETRRSYQPQTLAPDLMDFTRKYGCNAKRHMPVKGAVPSVSLAQIWNYECTKQLSTYQRDFGKDYLDILSVLNSLDPEEIKAYVEKAPHPEKAILQNFLNKVNGDKKSERPSTSKKPGENPLKCM